MPLKPAMKLSRMLTYKIAEVIILGRPLPPDRALEVLRRTDLYFRGPHKFTDWMRGENQAYCRALDAAFSYPGADRLARLTGLDDRSLKRLPEIWQHRWGVLPLRWFWNNQVLHGSGFCHPDGSLAFAGEMEDYPTGPEMLADLRCLARVFPEITMDVAVWCSYGQSMLGFPFFDGPDTPWPPELLARVSVPTVGFLVGEGRVTTVRGFDGRLFAGHGLRTPQAVERALHETRRLHASAPVESGFAQRDHCGLPDAVVHRWIAQARALGLTR